MGELDDGVDSEDEGDGGGMSVSDEYAAYMTSRRAEKGVDILKFWEVSPCCGVDALVVLTLPLTDQTERISYLLQNGNGLSANSGICCAL